MQPSVVNQPSAGKRLPRRTIESETSVVGIVIFLLRHKKMLGVLALLTAVIAVPGVMLWPPSYVAQAVILPPQPPQSSMAAFASAAMGGGIASSLGSQLGLKNPADLYICILKSRTVFDHIIADFHLQKVYKKKLLSDVRAALSSRAMFWSNKESLITISVKDRNPEFAAALANAFVEALYKENSRLALTGAAQKRAFFEQRLGLEKDALANAEVELKATQQSTGLLVPIGQAEVLIRSGAQLRTEIASRDVKLEAIRGYATEDNPEVQMLEREISALRGQQAKGETSGDPNSKLEISGARLPQASLQYIRKLREVKYHETLFELLAKQYEEAHLDEAKEAPLIQVLDQAVVPDRPSRRSRALSIMTAVVAALALGCLVAFAIETFAKLREGLRAALQQQSVI